MILEMKKISLLVLNSEKREALKQLRKLGLLHIQTVNGNSSKMEELKQQYTVLESAAGILEELVDKKNKVEPVSAGTEQSIETAQKVLQLTESIRDAQGEIVKNQTEIDRISKWGDFDPEDFARLAKKGICLTPYEIPMEAYKAAGDEIETLLVNSDKYSARVLVIGEDVDAAALPRGSQKFDLPEKSASQIRSENEQIENSLRSSREEIKAQLCFLDSLHAAQKAVSKKLEFENYESGIDTESLSDNPDTGLEIAYLIGYIPTEDLDKLLACAKENKWGIAVEDPTEEDDVPTKLRNNKFVSLIYPLTDFLGTVPGYFEYDISGWFLGFMLIFFGIIFGDGGYGLLITGIAAALIIKAKTSGKEIQPLYLLVGLFGLATIVWGTVTCTWFGLPAENIPGWLQKLSIPVISNVYENTIWYPSWTNGAAGTTTAQNLQIFCFALAVAQLSVAHIKGIVRFRKSLRLLGDLGSMLMIWGMFYIVLSLVVNGEVFGLGLVVNGIPVGTIAIAFIGVGFVLNFLFGSYNGNMKDAILDSLTNIISILLGVVNVFSDIVSYIRLWAVGLAGAAISQTVNEMAGPMMGRLTFMIFAIIILVFGHGLNMILNVLSMVVHGVRLNTLEFSSHLDMSWGGHKYEPFEEDK